MPAHYTAAAGDCNRISLLLRLDSQNGNRMRDALKEEMVEVCISITTCLFFQLLHTLASSSKPAVFVH